MTGPLTYHEASDGNLPDQIDRFIELSYRDLTPTAALTFFRGSPMNGVPARAIVRGLVTVLASAIHTKVESSLIIQLSCGNTLSNSTSCR